MKAMVMLDTVQFPDAGDYRTRGVVNALISMGIETEFHVAQSAGQDPTATDLNSLIAAQNCDMLVIPYYTGTNRGYHDNYLNGDIITVPVFVCGVVTNLGLNGASGYYDTSATFAQAEIVSTGGAIYTNTRRHALATETAPAESAPIVRGTGADAAGVTVWRYTPDGSKYVYYSSAAGRYNMLHLMIQDAIDKGLLSAPPKRAPIILNIDHINDGGDAPHDGGFQEQPDRLKLIGDLALKHNGVCYASLEKAWINGGTGGNLGNGTTSGTLLQNLKDYSDVFKYIACHDHNSVYTLGTAPGDAVNNQESKANIDASYQATKTATEGLGLTVNTDFAHCAGNRFGLNFLDLAQPGTDYSADPNGATPKAGYGFKVARVSSQGNASESYPVGFGLPSATADLPVHWMANRAYYKGILVSIPNRDGGTANGAVNDLSKDFTAFSYVVEQLNTGMITYHHGTDFEDASIRSGGLSTDGNAMTRGLLMWQTGSAYADACRDTVWFGADINYYV